MTTTYSKIPSFKEKIQGTSFIVVGRIKEETEINEDQSDNGSKFLIFHITIDRELKGQIGLPLVRVRVLDSQVNGIDTPVRIQMKTGDKVLLFLSPDYGPKRAEDSFVLYFNSSYHITDENKVKLHNDDLRDFEDKNIYPTDTIMNLEDIRSLIDVVEKDKQKAAAAIIEHEPTELRNMSYPEITELPSQRIGGARHSAPENKAEK